MSNLISIVSKKQECLNWKLSAALGYGHNLTQIPYYLIRGGWKCSLSCHMTCLAGVWLTIVMHHNSSISISFHIKSLTATLKLIIMNEGSLDWCTLLYSFLACAGSSCFSTQQAVLEWRLHPFPRCNELTNRCLSCTYVILTHVKLLQWQVEVVFLSLGGLIRSRSMSSYFNTENWETWNSVGV